MRAHARRPTEQMFGSHYKHTTDVRVQNSALIKDTSCVFELNQNH